MNNAERDRLIRNAIPIAVGTVFFLFFLLLCYYQELGPQSAKPSPLKFLLFGFAIGLGAFTLVIGAVEASGRLPGERGFGIALAVEGALLIILSLVAWMAMGPVPLSPG